MKKLLIIAGCLLLTACTDPNDITKLSKVEGWSQAVPKGYGWFSCSDDDVYKTKFTAIKNGQAISGTICRGWLKGATIRYN